jgi:hypothetical protein
MPSPQAKAVFPSITGIPNDRQNAIMKSVDMVYRPEKGMFHGSGIQVFPA